ncbi:MAG: AlpA family phage regulatory protein [Rhodoferax sp.]|nr:AlpA family phage regulatory protein [Rhodoferax sp.]
MQVTENHLQRDQKTLIAGNMHGKYVLLRIKQVQARVALGRSSIYALADKNSKFYDPSFPRSIKISVQAVGWIESEIDTWLMARIAASRCH